MMEEDKLAKVDTPSLQRVASHHGTQQPRSLKSLPQLAGPMINHDYRGGGLIPKMSGQNDQSGQQMQEKLSFSSQKPSFWPKHQARLDI